MSQWSIDPELSRRRLATLVRLLEREAQTKATQRTGELTAKEMQQWAHQCTNLLNAPASRARRIEDSTDEELLS